MRLNFVVIGAQKGGSTRLAESLAAHPDVYLPDREVALFRDPVYSGTAATQLSDELARVDPAKLTGIKCPDYLGRLEVAARLAELSVRPRLLAVLRDPVVRAVSAYFWYVRWGLLPLEDPNVGLMKVLDGSYAATNLRSDEIIEWGMYGKLLAHYWTYFDREEVCVIFNEDLRDRYDQTMRAVYSFLGIAPDTPGPRVIRASVNEGIYDLRRLKFLRRRNKFVLRWNDDRSYVDIPTPATFMQKALSGSVASIDSFVLSRVFRQGRPCLAEDLLYRLREVYAEDQALLQSLLGKPLSDWQGA